MRIVVGLFEWIDRVQSYYDPESGWDYNSELYKFVDGGFDEIDPFIETVNDIFVKGCHDPPCSSSFEMNRYRYGLERKKNFFNILKLVFDLPVGSSFKTITAIEEEHPGFSQFGWTVSPTPLPSTSPTPKPSRRPTPVPTIKQTLPPGTTLSPNIYPTNSPIELSNITQYNNGEAFVIDGDESSFAEETLVVTKKTKLTLKEGGYVSAPVNTDWPAVRLSIGSIFNGTGGVVTGSFAREDYEEGGGEAIQLNNGQSSTETASYAEFYDGITVIGGDAPGGIGGDALDVNGFGTEAIIYGGNFIGGKGTRADGYSLWVFNSGRVHVHGGSFQGDMLVERSGVIVFYGCFEMNGTRVTGLFSDDQTELDIDIRTQYGGKVVLTAVSEQECDTAPSMEPTNFPTMSPRPTVVQPKSEGMRLGSYVFAGMFIFALVQSIVCS